MELTNKTAICAISLLMIIAGLFLITLADENDADSITVDGLDYTLNGSTATIIGFSTDMPATSLFNIPSYIITGNKQYDVVSIADFAFKDCTAITDTIYIPKSIVTIGKGCFMGGSFKHITVENGSIFNVESDVLYKGTDLVSGAPKIIGAITIAEGTKKVYDYAFFNCTGITKLTVPATTPTFGERCFEGCMNMQWTPSLYYDAIISMTAVEKIGKYAFKDCYCIEGQLTISGPSNSAQVKISEGAFYNCTGLTSLVSNRDSLMIMDNCFHGCSNLLSIDIKSSTLYLSIQSNAFDSHTFYDDNDAIIEVNASTIKNHVFTGEAISHMTYKLYTIHYDPNGGVPDKADEQFNRGYKYTIPTNYVVYRDGYQFQGWNLNGFIYNPGTTVTVTEDMNFTAFWKQIVYHDVIFNLNGGTGSISSLSVKEGENFTLPSYTGTKAGYNFGGWSYNGVVYQPGNTLTMGYSNMTFSAVWNQTITHNVKFDLKGGSGTVSPMTIAEGSSFTLPLYSGTKTGYTFNGWEFNGTTYQPGTTMTMGSFDMNFAASWKEVVIKYTVYFDPNGGTCYVTKLETKADHTLPSLPSPAREGYTFEYWTYNGAEVTLNTQFDQNCTVYAKWSSNTIIPGVDNAIFGGVIIIIVIIGVIIAFRHR